MSDLNDRRAIGHRKGKEGDKKLGRYVGRGHTRALWGENTKSVKDTEKFIS